VTFFMSPVDAHGGTIHTVGCTNFKASLCASLGGKIELTRGAPEFDALVSIEGEAPLLRVEGQANFKKRVLVEDGTLQVRSDTIWRQRQLRTSGRGIVQHLPTIQQASSWDS
jgi:hypothetical protein